MATSELPEKTNGSEQTYEIPKKCKAGVVVDEGPNFRVEVQEVDVPEIGLLSSDPKDDKFANMCYRPR
jgi:hypothetical protein